MHSIVCALYTGSSPIFMPDHTLDHISASIHGCEVEEIGSASTTKLTTSGTINVPRTIVEIALAILWAS